MLSRGSKTKNMDRKPFGFSALLVLTLLSGGCATNQYMGISLRPGDADPTVQAVAALAATGDKHAQFQLATAFENGFGVERNCRKAKALFREASRDIGKATYVYSPSLGAGTSSRVLAVDHWPASLGLPEARAKLTALECV
jgi:TPR repeat protein